MGDSFQKFQHEYRVPFQRFFSKHISQQVYHNHVQNDQHRFAMHQVNQLEALYFERNTISSTKISMRFISSP